MKEDKLQSAEHARVRNVLRVAGPVTAGIGLLLVMVGIGSFFASFGSFEPPRFSWCAFVGMPLMFVGGVMSILGYMGAINRYVAGETAPVQKDVINYMGENIQPGVKSVAKAISEGITEGIIEAQKGGPDG